MELLAANAFLKSIQSALTENDDQSDLAIFGLSVLAFLVVVALVGRYLNPENRRRGNTRVDYLTAAVDMLGLTEQDRRDLLRIARVVELETPATMLLTPANFAAAVHHPETGGRDAELLSRMHDLCRRLFDAPLPDVAAG